MVRQISPRTKKGTKVTVTADDRPGYVFDHWESEQIRLTTSEATNPSLTFAMPDENVVLKAVPKTLYTITVEGGTVNNAVSARVKSGDPVTVVPEDKGADWKFIEWEGYQCTGELQSSNTSNPALQFNMSCGQCDPESSADEVPHHHRQQWPWPDR